jgi:hypothetical protein
MPPLPALSLREAEERAWRYWFADGLATLVAGVTCLLIAWFVLLDTNRPATPFHIAFTFVLLTLYGIVLLRQRELVEWLKSKVTYPRTGYVLPPSFAENNSQALDFTVLTKSGADAARAEEWRKIHEDRKRRAALTILLMGSTMLAMLVIRNPWICALAGIAMSAGLWIGAKKDQRLTWVVLAGFPLLGLYMSISRFGKANGPDRAAYFLAGAGVLFLMEGTVSVVRYLKENPRQKANKP